MAECVRHTPHDGEAETEAGAAAAFRCRAALEFFEDVVTLRSGNARTRIPNFDRDVAAPAARRKQQTTAIGITRGVGKEVLQNAAQHQRIGVDGEWRLTPTQLQAFAARKWFAGRYKLLEYVIESDRLDFRHKGASFELREIEDRRQQVFDRCQSR